MFRSLLHKFGVNLKRKATIINGESSSSSSLLAPPAKYFSRIQNQNLFLISKSRVVTSTFSSFSTATSTKSNVASSDFDPEFVVSYLINSCGLSKSEAINASEKLNSKTKTDFKTTSNPDSVLNLLKSYGFTECHISKLIYKDPLLLLSKPDKTLKPKLDFFKSKGLVEIHLANFISRFPRLLTRGLEKELIPSFDTLKSVVRSDENVIQMIQRNSWIIDADRVKRVMVNVELLRNEGVPEANIRKSLAAQPRAFTVNRFKENLEKVKEMGFNHLQITFVIALTILTSMTEANWRKKMDVYKRWGWSEAQIQTAFRKSSVCMKVSEKKIMAVMSFLVNDMGYDSSYVAVNPIVFTCSLQGRIIPRCSVIRVLVSRGLIQKNISLSTLTTMVDESFLAKFVKKYEQEVPGVMKVFKGQLNYQELLQN